MDDDEACEEDSSLLEKNLKELLPQYDVVIVTDYGHGMFTPKTINLLCSEAKFLAVNTQVNAGNQGFNTCSKYPRADFICISENELRIDVRSKQRPLEEIVNQEAVKSGFSKFLITRGNQGVVCFDKKEGYLEIPAFSGKIIDRVGAGDSVLAVSSLCVARDCSMDVVGLLGNAVGFHTVQTMCNRSAIDKLALLRTLEHSLK
jgi:bifunctional ADP-heptose synthase (sugar kinase/adenylyltransferase)